jgi:hypothetical protein
MRRLNEESGRLGCMYATSRIVRTFSYFHCLPFCCSLCLFISFFFSF